MISVSHISHYNHGGTHSVFSHTLWPKPFFSGHGLHRTLSGGLREIHERLMRERAGGGGGGGEGLTASATSSPCRAFRLERAGCRPSSPTRAAASALDTLSEWRRLVRMPAADEGG